MLAEDQVETLQHELVHLAVVGEGELLELTVDGPRQVAV